MVAVSGGWRGGGGGRGGRKETRSKEGGSLPSPLGDPEPWVTFCPSFSGTDCPGNLSWGEEGEEERRNTANFLHSHPLPSLPLFFFVGNWSIKRAAFASDIPRLRSLDLLLVLLLLLLWADVDDDDEERRVEEEGEGRHGEEGGHGAPNNRGE